MKNICLLLWALAALLSAGCGKNAPSPPSAKAAAAAPAPEKGAEEDDSEFDEAPGLDEEGSREW